MEEKDDLISFSTTELRSLFQLKEGTLSDTHDKIKCDRCKLPRGEQSGSDSEAEASDCEEAHAHAQNGGGGEMRNGEMYQQQIGFPVDEDLKSWSHHTSYNTVEDPIMREAQAGHDMVRSCVRSGTVWY